MPGSTSRARKTAPASRTVELTRRLGEWLVALFEDEPRPDYIYVRVFGGKREAATGTVFHRVFGDGAAPPRAVPPKESEEIARRVVEGCARDFEEQDIPRAVYAVCAHSRKRDEVFYYARFLMRFGPGVES